MAIVIDDKSRVVVQGITGRNASLHTGFMLDYGTRVVGGVTPGKGGQEVHGVKVYDTMKRCVLEHPEATVSSVWVPPRFAKEAILEAIDAGIKSIIVITERIPIHDMLYVRSKAEEHDVLVIGGNTPGVISPGKCLVGMLPKVVFSPGRIGTVARSGAITYYIANSLTLAGLGESTCVGLGGDPVLGSSFEKILKLFEEDPETEGVVLAGEIGGVYEELAAPYISQMKTPLVAFISGRVAPQGKRLGHAGAIIEGEMGTAESKIKALQEAGVSVAKTLSEIPELLVKRQEELNRE